MQEDEKTKLDRELIELLNELRVVLPGVQVIFAFLLAVPFAQRFTDVSRTQRGVFFGALLCTALSTTLLMAPTAQHRLRWRARDKERLLQTANRLTLVGLTFLAASLGLVVYLVADFIYDATAAAVSAGSITLLLVIVWYVVPLLRHVRDGGSSERPDHAR